MVKVYLIDTKYLNDDITFNNSCELMSTYRLEKIYAQASRQSRNLSLGAGLALNEGLAIYGLSEKDAVYSYNRQGKPYITGHEDIHYNLSHSGTMAVCVLSNEEIGVDIERLRIPDSNEKLDILLNRYEKICRRFFAESECDAILSVQDKAERVNTFIRYWTLKESFVKAVGLGTQLAFNSFEIEISEGSAAPVMYGGRQYYYKEYEVTGYKLSVCCTLNSGNQ